MEFPTDPNVIVGLERADDAGVYRVTDTIALIQTVDFFTPVVDDPYGFGQIAAANALSDVYAMGGVPKTAMNLVGFPSGEMDIGVLRQVIQGGLDKVREADVVMIGGHSVIDKEFKYGLSVTGFVHPDNVLTKRNLCKGDRLILTKPIGTGIINTAIKGKLVSPAATAEVTALMATLNRRAAETMAGFPVHACTDITGFGLLGHLAEMITGAGRSLEIDHQRVPLLPDTLKYAGMGMVPGGAYRNKTYRAPMVVFAPTVSAVFRDVLFDPQTSGGLLICVSAEAADDLQAGLIESGAVHSAVIGCVTDDPAEKIRVS